MSRMDELEMKWCLENLEYKGKYQYRVDQKELRRFGHVGRIYEYGMTRRMLMAEESGGQVRGRPRLGMMDGVKVP